MKSASVYGNRGLVHQHNPAAMVELEKLFSLILFNPDYSPRNWAVHKAKVKWWRKRPERIRDVEYTVTFPHRDASANVVHGPISQPFTKVP